MDVLDYIIGVVISQLNSKGWLKPIAFYLRKIINAELNYKIYNKKLLAIIMAFKEWRIYFKGSIYSIKVLIDYKNLLYFTTTKKLNRR